MSIDRQPELVDPRAKPIRYIRSGEPTPERTAAAVPPLSRRRPSGNLTKGQKRLARVAFLAGAVVTLAGYATNFTSLIKYAKDHHFAIPAALPIGLDLAIPTLLAIDYLATVKGANAAFLRWAAWALTGFTVFAGAISANGSDADHFDVGSMILHGVMPAISVVFVEAARWYRMYLDGLTDGSHTDRIPLARWVCAPYRTPKMRRRMVLWNERSYPVAVAREAALLYARALLDGAGLTRRNTPVSLRHQIKTGQVPSVVAAAIREAVTNEDESWQPAVEQWIAGHLAKLNPDVRPDIKPDTAPDMSATAGPDTIRLMSVSAPDMSAGHHAPPDIDTPDVRTSAKADTHPDTTGPVAGHAKAPRRRGHMSAGRPDIKPDTDTDMREADADIDSEAAALGVLSIEPDISGAELGRRLGLSDRQGRRILKALTASHGKATDK